MRATSSRSSISRFAIWVDRLMTRSCFSSSSGPAVAIPTSRRKEALSRTALRGLRRSWETMASIVSRARVASCASRASRPLSSSRRRSSSIVRRSAWFCSYISEMGSSGRCRTSSSAMRASSSGPTGSDPGSRSFPKRTVVPSPTRVSISIRSMRFRVPVIPIPRPVLDRYRPARMAESSAMPGPWSETRTRSCCARGFPPIRYSTFPPPA